MTQKTEEGKKYERISLHTTKMPLFDIYLIAIFNLHLELNVHFIVFNF